ncbi:hypothetical protein, partial [Streptomyces sp. NRRL B-1347]|uniref:hypothetical protein n=1 Tax=Streptomyces sp. NRRL B-1347 TaxID=1476877 RepID=UPI001F1B5446
SFVLTLSGFPPGASLRYFVFPTLSDLSGFPVRSDFLGAFRPFGLPAVPTLSDLLGFPIRSDFHRRLSGIRFRVSRSGGSDSIKPFPSR